MSEEMGRERTRPPRGSLVAVGVILLLLLAPSLLLARTWILTRSANLLEPGVRFSWHTDQKKHLVATYTSSVEVVRVTRGDDEVVDEVAFKWRIFDSISRPGLDDKGEITTNGMRRGAALNTWWSKGQRIATRDTHVWISHAACEELRDQGQTHYAIDVNDRRDAPILLHLIGTQSVEVAVDGRPRRFGVMNVRSAKGDLLSILDDCSNPLVVQANIPGIVFMELRAIETGSSGQEGGRP